MNFSVFDIVSKMVPGGLFLSVVLFVTLPSYSSETTSSFKETIDLLAKFEGLLTILATLLTYFVGYVIEGIGSIIVEPIVWYIWGGWPIQLLYHNKTNSRTTFPHNRKVFAVLTRKCFLDGKFEGTKSEFDELYYFSTGILQSKGNLEQIQRQANYVESYLFNRNLYASMLIISVLIAIPKTIFNWSLWPLSLLSIGTLLFVHIRLKDRALYQTRHLLNSVYNILL